MKDGTSEVRIVVDSRQRIIGRAYVPDQVFGELYDSNTALIQGTVFAELDMPYVPKNMAGYK